jgi:methylmalonyl-CoA mutase
MLVAKMGQDGHDRGRQPRRLRLLPISASKSSRPLFQTPKESARLAIDKDVDVVGASASPPATRP